MRLSKIIYQCVLKSLIILFCLFPFAFAQGESGDKNCAMVLMHGKWGNPASMAFLERRYKDVCTSKSSEMPWSQRRNYDQPYEVALDEIEKQVKEFRFEGYKKIILVGHSFGANAGFAYASTNREKVDGVVALAPGHSPSAMYSNGQSQQVDHALALIQAGSKEAVVSVVDMNQGVNRGIRMTAEVAFSYFDPKGLGNMSLSAARYSSSIPTMVVIGNGDPGFPWYRPFIFEKLPENPLNVYLEITAMHANTPERSVSQVLEWVKKVVQP